MKEAERGKADQAGRCDRKGDVHCAQDLGSATHPLTFSGRTADGDNPILNGQFQVGGFGGTHEDPGRRAGARFDCAEVIGIVEFVDASDAIVNENVVEGSYSQMDSNYRACGWC